MCFKGSILKKTVNDVLLNDTGEILPLMEDYILSPEKLTESMVSTWKASNPNKRIPESLKVDNLWLLPSNIHLSGADIELATKIGRESRLKEGIS